MLVAVKKRMSVSGREGGRKQQLPAAAANEKTPINRIPLRRVREQLKTVFLIDRPCSIRKGSSLSLLAIFDF